MLGGIKIQGKMEQACQEFLSSDVGEDNVGQTQNQRREARGRQRPLWPSGADCSCSKGWKDRFCGQTTALRERQQFSLLSLLLILPF